MRLSPSGICNGTIKTRAMEIINLNYNSTINPLSIKTVETLTYEYDRAIHVCLQALFIQGEVKTSSHMHQVNIPKTWWDMFKIKYFPKWALKKWPAAYNNINMVNTYNTYNVCPHLVTDPKSTHIKFLDFGDN